MHNNLDKGCGPSDAPSKYSGSIALTPDPLLAMLTPNVDHQDTDQEPAMKQLFTNRQRPTKQDFQANIKTIDFNSIDFNQNQEDALRQTAAFCVIQDESKAGQKQLPRRNSKAGAFNDRGLSPRFRLAYRANQFNNKLHQDKQMHVFQ